AAATSAGAGSVLDATDIPLDIARVGVLTFVPGDSELRSRLVVTCFRGNLERHDLCRLKLLLRRIRPKAAGGEERRGVAPLLEQRPRQDDAEAIDPRGCLEHLTVL